VLSFTRRNAKMQIDEKNAVPARAVMRNAFSGEKIGQEHPQTGNARKTRNVVGPLWQLLQIGQELIFLVTQVPHRYFPNDGHCLRSDGDVPILLRQFRR
jgi:hypothetical protein